MIGSIYAQHAVRCPSRCLQQFLNKFSTAVNVKPVENTNSSYVESIGQEFQNAKPYSQLPGLTKFQLIRGFMKGGEFHDVSLNDFVLKCRQRYGDIFVMPGVFGKGDTVVLFNVDDFEKVHRTEGPYPNRPGNEAMVYYRERRPDKFFEDVQGLIAGGEQWGKFRSAVNPVLMQPRNAKLYLEPMQKVNEEFLQRIREIRNPDTLEMPDNFIDDINHLTFESVAVVALDKQFGLIRQNQKSAEATLFFSHLQVVLKSMYDLGIKPSMYQYLPTPTYRRFKKSMDTIFDITGKYVNEALQRIESDSSNTEGRSVLEKLLKIDRKIAVVMVMDMLFAGVDTSSSVLSGILLCLAKNPEKQSKLREEILAIVPNKESKFSIDNMQNLPYLRACIKEALRIYPLAFGNARLSGMDLALSGYSVPKDTICLMCSNLLLKEERFYPQPNAFIPERWLRNEADSEPLMANTVNPFVYLPFGFGPRSCVGKRIIDLELELTLGNLVRNFNIEYNYSTDNAYQHHFVSTPRIPLKFKFTDLN